MVTNGTCPNVVMRSGTALTDMTPRALSGVVVGEPADEVAEAVDVRWLAGEVDAGWIAGTLVWRREQVAGPGVGGRGDRDVGRRAVDAGQQDPGVAEILALRIRRQEAYGPLIPAVGVTPWFLSGALFPISVLPSGIEQLTLLSPWTHAVAVLRHGLMQGSDPGLAAIWHLDSEPVMAALSTLVLALFAATTLTLAVRAFRRATTA